MEDIKPNPEASVTVGTLLAKVKARRKKAQALSLELFGSNSFKVKPLGEQQSFSVRSPVLVTGVRG